METEVVVVGGGIGGLTVAALLAARGLEVCLIEREATVGGCAATVEKFGYNFEQGYGLFSGWGPNDIHHLIFAELPVDPPEVHRLDLSYSVRLPDKSEVFNYADRDRFEANLTAVFPECAKAAIDFYLGLDSLAARHHGVTPLGRSAIENSACVVTDVAELQEASWQTANVHLENSSLRFQRFIDAQLQAFGQGNSAQVSYLYAALALSAARGGMFEIRGGASALAARLAESIEKSGGRIRLNSAALRLSYNSSGDAIGVDLLTGETVTASRAIISNLTIWDTYGKLIGLNRIPTRIRQELKSKRGWGAYLLYLGWDADKSTSPAARVLSVSDWQSHSEYGPENNQLFFCPAPIWDPRAPAGKRAVSVHSFTDVDEWFTYHTDETELEAQDQQMLEQIWQRLHEAIPELCDSIEVIDTANPRTSYEATRRKLGMVGGLVASPEAMQHSAGYLTAIPNLFAVSDTLVPGGVAGVSQFAMNLANKITS